MLDIAGRNVLRVNGLCLPRGSGDLDCARREYESVEQAPVRLVSMSVNLPAEHPALLMNGVYQA